eukprot:2605902-Alexandrium_andersonii.AAC.1
MSASLVGSEMCIRDRFAACFYGRGGHWGRPVDRRRLGALAQWHVVQPTACLLYTSDAADDM